jgi:hypothetical protein
VNSLIERDELIPIYTWNSSEGSIFNLQYIFTGVERDTDFFTNFTDMTFSTTKKMTTKLHFFFFFI